MTRPALRLAVCPPVLAGLALAACAGVLLAAAIDPAAALRAWLAGAVFASALPLGALVLVMMMRLIPGLWDDELEPFAEAALPLLPLAALLFLPVVLGAGALYGWTADPGEGAFRGLYLTRGFFALRTLTFFAVAIGLAALLLLRRAWSTPVSAAGLCVHVLLAHLVAADWLIALDDGFHSSGFPLYVLSLQVTIAFAALLLAAVLSPAPIRQTGILGSLLFAFLLASGYFAFMQYFILWSGNLPPGAAWYGHRGAGLWSIVEFAIGAASVVPLLLLLFAPVRAGRRWLAGLSLVVLFGKALEAAWLVLPANGEGSRLAAVLAVLAIGALALLFALGFAFALRHPVARRDAALAPGARP